MSSQIEVVVDGRVNGDEFLKASPPPETEHGMFSSPERQVCILRPIVQPVAGLLQTGSAQSTQSRSVRSQPIRDERIRSAVALHQFPEKFHISFAVSLLRDKGLQHLAFLVDGAPKVMAFAVDLHEHLIEVPLPSRKRAHLIQPFLADLGGKKRAVSWFTSIPRSCRRSSTLRSDGGKRTYIITARRMISGDVLK